MAKEFIARNGLIVTSGQIQGLLASGIVISGSIASGSVNNFKLSSGASISNLLSGSISGLLIANSSILSGNISSGILSQNHFGSGSVSSGQIAANSVVSGSFASGQVSNFALSSGASIFNLLSGSIGSGLLGNASVLSGTISSGQVGYPHLAGIVAGAGYFVGGSDSLAAPVNTGDKLNFSNDTTIAKTTANLSTSRYGVTGVSQNVTKGYLAGGYDEFGSPVVSADKLVFSNDTSSASTSSNLSQARSYSAGCSGEGTKGYFTGGFLDGNNTTVSDKITYSNDTTAAQTTADLPIAIAAMSSVTEGTTKGFFAGGYDNGGNDLTDLYRITYSNDTTSSVTVANLSQNISWLSGVTGETTKGYFIGGYLGGTIVDTADKIVYSTEVVSAQASANLSTARYASAGVSQGSSKGFVAGGSTTGGASTIADKITYSTDTTAAQTTADLSQARSFLASVNQYQGSSAAYSIFSGHFANNSINSGSIAAGEIGQMHLSSGCIVSGHIISESVYGDVLGSGAIVSGNIASGSIGFNEFGREIVNNDIKQNNFRLGVVSGVPISSGDLTARTTLFLNPYNGDSIMLYDGSDWSVYTTSGTSVSIATSALASGQVYDVYCYSNAGVPDLEYSASWTNINTRSDAVSYVNGVPVKATDSTRRVIGTVYARTSGIVDDSYQYRGVWNWDNRVSRAMHFRTTSGQTYNVSGGLNARPYLPVSAACTIFWAQGYPGIGCQVSMGSTSRRSAGAATAYARVDGITNAFVDFIGNLTLSTTAEWKVATGIVQGINGLNFFYPQIGMNASGTIVASEARVLNIIEG
jgi:hypothetical protein